MSSRLRVLVLCGVVIALVGVIEFWMWDVAAGVLYIAAIMIALWSPRRSDVVVVSAVSTVLTVLSLARALVLADRGDYSSQHLWLILANWMLAVFAILVTTVIGLRRKRVEQQLAQLNATLEQRVAERTAHAEQRELELSRLNASLEQEIGDRQRAEKALRASEAFSQSLVENLPLNVFQKDKEGHIVFANQRYCDNLGLPYHELIGKTDFDLFPEDLARKYRHDDHVVVETGRPWEDIEQHQRPDGNVGYVHVLKAPVYDADGENIGTQGMFWDVTARFQAEEAQKRSDARFRRLVESDIIGIMICSLSGRIYEANDAFLEMTGHTRDDLANNRLNWGAMTPPEHLPKDEEAIRQLLAHGTAVPWEKEYIRKDGRRVPVLLGVTLLEESSDECICFVLDITERKRAEVQLRAAKEAADAASQAKSQFLANMSHEVRTPMNAIIGMTELVLNTPLTSEQREYLTMVLESSEALLAVINDVLDFSKVEAGKLKLERIPFDVREMLGDTMKTLAMRAHGKSLELACQVDGAVPVQVVGDPGRLRQIVVNLVGNAIKFTDVGEVVLRAEVEQQGEDYVDLHVSVADTGVGIPDELRAAIFFAFEQGDASTTRRFGGTGLGLAISASLVELMQGRIWVDSEVGKGSTFHFVGRFGRAAEAGEAPQAVLPGAIEGGRVLVVDDNATNRRILQEMLRGWKMEPAEVSSVDEALAALQQARDQGRPFRLVISDVNMPRAGGFELAEQMRADEQLQGSLILMLTSGDSPGDIARCEQLDVAGYLMKPVKQSELFDAVALALGVIEAADERTTAARQKGRRLSPLRLLLAEDSLVNQKLAVGLLTRHGHQVVVVSNGLQAVEAARENCFDAVLMDVQMPEMDGLEATRAIRAHERNTGRRTPVMAMTAHAMSGDRERCLAAGMDDYIAKPIRAEQLFDTLARLVRKAGTPEGADRCATGPPSAAANDGSPESAAAVVNWSEALSAVNGDEDLLRDVAEASLDESVRLLEDIRRAIDDGDGTLLRRSAHTLKGSVRLFGAHQASELAYRLETMGRDSAFGDAAETLAALEIEIERLRPVLLEFVDRRAAQEK